MTKSDNFHTIVLAEIEGEPRVRDEDLGASLGYARPRAVRQIIEANLEEIQGYGLTPRRVAPIISGKGRVTEVEEFWLNEPQALLVCMFSKAPRAMEARREVVEVYLAWRHGEFSRKAQGRLFQIPKTLPEALRLAAAESERADKAEVEALQS